MRRNRTQCIPSAGAGGARMRRKPLSPVDITPRPTTFIRLPHAEIVWESTLPDHRRHFGELRADTYGPARGRESGFDERENDAGVPPRRQCRPAGPPSRREGSREASAGQLDVEQLQFVTLGAPWVPIRAAVRVYPAMADGYRLSFSRATWSTRIFAGARIVSRCVRRETADDGGSRGAALSLTAW